MGSSKIDLTKDTAYVHPSTKQCNYAYTHPTSKQCNYNVDTSSFATKAEIEELKKKISIGNIGLETPVLGARIRIGGFDYMIVHIASTVVYALLEDIHEMTRFGTDTPYAGSIIANRCTTWYNNTVPASLRNAGIFVNENVDGVNFPCFIPTYNQCNGGFSYFNSDSRDGRRCALRASGSDIENENVVVVPWWTSTYSSNSWIVSIDGGFGRGYLSDEEGFRPCLAIKRSAFS